MMTRPITSERVERCDASRAPVRDCDTLRECKPGHDALMMGKEFDWIKAQMHFRGIVPVTAKQ